MIPTAPGVPLAVFTVSALGDVVVFEAKDERADLMATLAPMFQVAFDACKAKHAFPSTLRVFCRELRREFPLVPELRFDVPVDANVDESSHLHLVRMAPKIKVHDRAAMRDLLSRCVGRLQEALAEWRVLGHEPIDTVFVLTDSPVIWGRAVEKGGLEAKVDDVPVTDGLYCVCCTRKAFDAFITNNGQTFPLDHPHTPGDRPVIIMTRDGLALQWVQMIRARVN